MRVHEGPDALRGRRLRAVGPVNLQIRRREAELRGASSEAVDDGARQRFGRSESPERPRDLLGHRMAGMAAGCTTAYVSRLLELLHWIDDSFSA